MQQFGHKTPKKPNNLTYSRSRMDIWCRCSENETAKYVTSTTNRASKMNWTHNRKMLVLCEGDIQHMIIPIKNNDNKKCTNITSWEKPTPILDYMETYQNTVTTFQASDMILCAHTDASYLTEPKACSCAAGYFLSGSMR